ncbi:Hypothetical predicted protein [Podarcis lilfordi]|uniref:Reverse transcriptase zinc-binding domain-containing protein n=1 Tax=Podarcis lilfordi TaxID=74358 RepID=A0AA35PMC1_9SAUR|nr:Hypothetical predicted protein [Podarcis lilfordi]
MIKWAQDVGHNIMMEDWVKLWKTDLKFTDCSLLKENYMKMMYRWCTTPVQLGEMYKTSSNICWKCKEKEGTFYHMWWDCKAIKKIWEMIYNELKKMFHLTFVKNPEAFLLGIVGKDLPKKLKNIFMYATTAVRVLVAQGWKSE